MVFAGQPLSDDQKNLSQSLGVANRVIEVLQPDNLTLEVLYNGAHSLVFPSRFEGFGWPIVEAQACGCPVICSDRDPFPEVSGGAAVFCDADDPVAFGNAIVSLREDASRRGALVSCGLKNAARLSSIAMTSQLAQMLASSISRFKGCS